MTGTITGKYGIHRLAESLLDRLKHIGGLGGGPRKNFQTGEGGRFAEGGKRGGGGEGGGVV